MFGIKLICLRSELNAASFRICMDAVFFGTIIVFNNFLLIDATDRSKISSDQKRFFIALSLYPLSFFANTPFNVNLCKSDDHKPWLVPNSFIITHDVWRRNLHHCCFSFPRRTSLCLVKVSYIRWRQGYPSVFDSLQAQTFVFFNYCSVHRGFHSGK